MKITILAVGSRCPLWVEDAVADYLKRLRGAGVAIEFKAIKAEKRTASVTTQANIATEHKRLSALLPRVAKLIVLDEQGQSWNTAVLSGQMQAWFAQGQELCFVIGGADGLSAQLKAQADVLFQLSALTLPHALVRVLLVEQIYRCITILTHHPYHRA